MNRGYEDSYRGRRVMVTGGLGFIGSNLARRLGALGARVTVVDSLIPGCGANRFNLDGIQGDVTVAQVDLRDTAALTPRVREQEFIFNLAGQVSHIDSMRDPLQDLEINCRSHLALLEICRHHRCRARVFYAGTRQQYGRPLRLPVDETHPSNPTDVNGINKMSAEWYHLLYHRVYGLPACSLRLTNTFGPRQLLEHARQGFLSVFIRRALENETIELFGDGSQLRDYTYVDDAVDAFLMAGQREDVFGEVYNLGSTEVLSVKQIAEMMITIAGSGSIRVIPFPEERKRIDIGSYYGSFEKIRRQLGWSPRVPVAEGLRRTLAYYREHKHHYYGK
jgi:UDP-glucose 4-epimerase